MTSEGTAIVPYATGLIAATLTLPNEPLPCHLDHVRIVDERATIELTTRGGVELRITVEEIA